MPELPEVQTLVSDLRPILLGQKVKLVAVTEPRMLGGIAPDSFSGELLNKTLESIERHGKYILFHWKEDKSILLLHMGQAGWMVIRDEKDCAPKFTRVSWVFGNKKALHYINARLLGVVALIHNGDFSAYPSLTDMGPEVWSEQDGPISGKTLAERVMHSKRPIKEVLLDQTVVSGLGNLWGDELLFQAGIDPRRLAVSLSSAEVAKMAVANAKVIAQALAVRADLAALPKDYLLIHRKKDDLCPKCGKALEKYKAGARHWYYCPRDQK